jgi:hypothetical protein
MMFTMDLLKGKGVPEKADIRRTVLRVAGLLPPLAALALLAGAWRYDHQQKLEQDACIHENEQIIELFSDQVKAYRRAGTRVNSLQKQLGQVGRALQCRIQVTDLLRELTEKLPADIFLHDIRLDRAVRTEKYQLENSSEIKQRRIIGRTVTLTLCNFNTTGGDRLVQNYADELKQSEQAARLFKKVEVTACQQGKVDERSATFYSLQCELVEQIQE